ncbi:MAG: hypothetical protein ACO1SX_24710 [Actinomycetota bacterium]
MGHRRPLAAVALILATAAPLLAVDSLPRRLARHQSSVMAVDYSPDGKTLASGSCGPESLLWLWPMKGRK